MRLFLDAVRLAVGTLTVLPVGHPSRVDRRVAGWAMTLAPYVGCLLAAAAALVAWLAGLGAGPLLSAVLVLGVLAVLTRALHLDGLADVADGLGSRAPAERALAIMKQSDIGPFGVATLLLVLLADAAALAEIRGPWVLPAAVVASRLVLPVLCAGLPTARPDGLGAMVARSVPLWQLVPALLPVVPVAWLCPSVLVGPVAGLGFAWYSARRFGGITGDVLGAAVETALIAALVAGALAS